jgi:hypothetical protein
MDIIPSENLNIFNNVISDLQLLQSRYDTNILTLNNKIHALYDENSIFHNKIDELSDILNNIKTENNIMKNESEKLMHHNMMLLKESENHQNTVSDLFCDIENYKKKIKSLEDDRNEFTKVSHVVMIEKDNNKLRLECENLKNKIKSESLRKENKNDSILLINKDDNIIESPIKKEFNIVVQHFDEKNTIPIIAEVIELQESSIIAEVIEISNKPVGIIPIIAEVIEISNKPVGIIPIIEVFSQVQEEDDNNNIDVYEKKIKGIVYYISSDDTMKIYKKNVDGTIGIPLGFLEKYGEKRKVKWDI